MRAEQVVMTPTCSEWKAVWLPADEERWRAYLDSDDEVQFFCESCGNTRYGVTS